MENRCTITLLVAAFACGCAPQSAPPKATTAAPAPAPEPAPPKAADPQPTKPTVAPAPTPARASSDGALMHEELALFDLAGPFADDAAICEHMRVALEVPREATDDPFVCTSAAKAGMPAGVHSLRAGIEAPMGEGLVIGFAVLRTGGWYVGHGLARLNESVHGGYATRADEPKIATIDVAGRAGLQVDLDVREVTGVDEEKDRLKRRVQRRTLCVLEPTPRCTSVLPMKIENAKGKQLLASTASVSSAGELTVALKSTMSADEDESFDGTTSKRGTVKLLAP
ncbi:MAG TPA: hypothetical protein VG755_33525 [Nannocystaceae bacterium]|nr:hypothetical protein [Nannocystaceae bacterium]